MSLGLCSELTFEGEPMHRTLHGMLIVVCAFAAVAWPAAGATGAGDETVEEVEGSESLAVCPPPFLSAHQGCVLDSDLVLEGTVALTSFTKFDCRGHTVLPAVVGTASTPSQPAVAFLLNHAFGVELTGCVIGDAGSRFDIGVYILNGTLPAAVRSDRHALERLRNRIRNNVIWAGTFGVRILSADDNEVAENRIAVRLGNGVHVQRTASLNTVRGNLFTSDGLGTPGANDSGVLVANPPGMPLLEVRVGSALLQFPNVIGEDPEDNHVEGNTAMLPGPTGPAEIHAGFVAAVRSRRTVIRDNIVVGAGEGVRIAGFPRDQVGIFPGVCSLDPGRYCGATSSDCFFAGIDSESKGTCTCIHSGSPGCQANGTEKVAFDARATDARVEDNMLVGPFSAQMGIFAYSNVGSLIRGNTLIGTGTETGIVLTGDALETATVTRNALSGFAHGLGLFADFPIPPFFTAHAEFFGARFFQNDVVGSLQAAVFAQAEYAYPSELSVDLVGNYWGRSCAEGGFLPGDSTNPALIADDHPFGEPVSGIEDADNLPATCR